jgi:hypothetical protein
MDDFVPRPELELSRRHKFQAAKSRKLLSERYLSKKVVGEASPHTINGLEIVTKRN